MLILQLDLYQLNILEVGRIRYWREFGRDGHEGNDDDLEIGVDDDVDDDEDNRGNEGDEDDDGDDCERGCEEDGNGVDEGDCEDVDVGVDERGSGCGGDDYVGVYWRNHVDQVDCLPLLMEWVLEKAQKALNSH